MKPNASASGWKILILSGLLCGDACGLTIFRFGGASLPPPDEAGLVGVEFHQRSWSEVDVLQGGETFRLDVDDAAIRALRYDPQVNFAPAFKERGAKMIDETVTAPVYDGDTGTAWFAAPYLCAETNAFYKCTDDDYAQPGAIDLFFAYPYILDRVRVISGLSDPAGIASNISVYLATHDFRLTETVYYRRRLNPRGPITAEVKDNREHVVDIPIPPVGKVYYIQVVLGEHRNPWEINEVELFAKGYVDKSTYVSDRLDFGAEAALGDVRFSALQEPGAQVVIRTRSGADDDPDLYWKHTGRGDQKVEVSRAEYEKLKVGEKAGTTYDLENWTLWSAPYDLADSSGVAVLSLSPRRYLQFKVDFIPEEESGGELRYFEVRASTPPVASRAVGEIHPREADVGETTRFTYFLKPTVEGEATGFDRLKMATPAIIASVDSVRLGEVDVPFDLVAMDEHGFEISFPRVDQQDTDTLFEVVFAARVLRYGSSFDARVFDSNRPLEVPQGVHAGNVLDEVEGDAITVVTTARAESLLEVGAARRTFTPNRDGVNDMVGISYDLFEVTGSASVTVEIRDLAGRRVRTLYEGRDFSGHHKREWDGRDLSGRVVPPGVYLYTVSMDADDKQVEKPGLIRVVY